MIIVVRNTLYPNIYFILLHIQGFAPISLNIFFSLQVNLQ